jgi:hypothetical protein
MADCESRTSIHLTVWSNAGSLTPRYVGHNIAIWSKLWISRSLTPHSHHPPLKHGRDSDAFAVSHNSR